MLVLSFAEFFFLSKLSFSKKCFPEHSQCVNLSNSLDPDQDRHFVGKILQEAISRRR